MVFGSFGQFSVGFWWFLVVFCSFCQFWGGFWWFLVVFGSYRQFLLVLSWFLLVFGSFCCFSLVLSWFLEFFLLVFVSFWMVFGGFQGFSATIGYKWQQIGYFVNNLNKWHLLAIISNNWQQLFIVLQQMPTIGILWQHMFGKFWREMSSFANNYFIFSKCQFCAKCLRMKCPLTSQFQPF